MRDTAASVPVDVAGRGSRLAVLLGHGALELRSVDDAPPAATRYRSVSGARVAIGVPPGWRRRVSSWCLFDTPDGPRGFQQAPRGTSLFALLPQSHLVRLDRYVSLAGGVLAHYHLDWGPESVSGFTVWQGSHSDVFTYDFTAFGPALATFAACAPQDGPRGARLTPPLSWSLREEEVTVETGPPDSPVLVSAAHRSRANPPVWAGTLGRGAEFYRLETGGQRLLAVTDSAVAEIDTVAADTVLSGEHLVGLAEHLSLEWTPRARFAVGGRSG